MSDFAWYNENNPEAAEWLRELMKAKVIAPGIVDERSITEVAAAELREFRQCHFFAGIGVWSYALRCAGWPDARPVWTGSCPCQPFSAAGSQAGFSDDRHLWPVWFELIRECCPLVVFGEQVGSPLGLHWLDAVSADVEGAGYAIGAANFPAAGVGAPHIRQRLYFVADTEECGRAGGAGLRDSESRRIGRNEPADDRGDGGLAHADSQRRDGQQVRLFTREPRPDRVEAAGDCGACGMANPGQAERRAWSNNGPKSPPEWGVPATDTERRGGIDGMADTSSGGLGIDGRAPGATRHTDERGPTHGFWRVADWLGCTDGKWRPVEPESFPLAHGAPGRVGRLRGYGNGLCAPVAQAFIEAYQEVRESE